MSGYVKKLKFEDKSNRLMFYRIDDEKILQKYKANWTKLKT